MVRTTRDYRFELLRLIAMLLIVATHFFASDNWAVRTNGNLANTWQSAFHDSLTMFGQVGVALFVLISAFFMATSHASPARRLRRLWIQVFIYSAGALAAYTILLRLNLLPESTIVDLSLGEVVISVMPVIFNAYWFISAFFVMSVLGPFINTLFDHLTRKRTYEFTGIMLALTFLWRLANPRVPYFNDALYLCTLYILGCTIRRYAQSMPKIRAFQVVLVVVGGFALCVAGTYVIKNSAMLLALGYPANLITSGPGSTPIPAICAATAVFLHLAQRSTGQSADSSPANTRKQRKQPGGIAARIILALSPATLGIYLIHENFLLKPVLWSMVFTHAEPNGPMAKTLFAVAAIAAIYLMLLVISLVIHHLVVRPITTLTDNILNRQ